MKIALAQISTDPGRIAENTAKIKENISKALAEKADLIVFPELCIPSYALMDLALNQSYISANKEALDEIAAHADGIAIIIGFIDQDLSKIGSNNAPLLYNAAAFIENKSVKSVIHKTLLPDYDIFFEKRYFTSGNNQKVIEFKGKKIGLEICEDIWDENYPVKVTKELKNMGAEMIINISASPFNLGKLKERKFLVETKSREFGLDFIYVNLVGGYDGYEGELVFDGRSLVYNKNGEQVLEGKSFSEDLIFVDTESLKKAAIPVAEEIEKVYQALTLGIKDYFRKLGLKSAFIGLSGGIDSAVVAALAVKALGKENVFGVTMPSHITSSETKSDALRLAENLQIKCHTRPITSEYEAWLKDFEEINKKKPERLTKQNKQARIRGSILMEYTNETPAAIVLTTGNKTELALGYCTLYGDMCGGLAPISDLNKELVYQLAEYINESENKELIPKSIIERIPTAELEEGQTDRDNLPADYPVLAPLVDRLIEGVIPVEELEDTYKKEVVQKTIKLINLNEFKRRQAPPGIKISKKAFGSADVSRLAINFHCNYL